MSARNSQIGSVALLSVTAGVAIGLIASHTATPNTLYTPTVAKVQTVAPTTHRTTLPARIEAVRASASEMPEQTSAPADEYYEEVVYPEQSAPLSWAPVAALIALPTAIAAFLLRKSDQTSAASPLTQVKLGAAGVAASAVLATSAAMPAYATPMDNLTPCAESKAFEKNLKKEVKSLTKRQKKYEEGSAPYLALEATKAKTERRFANYAKEGLLCGDDGLPHLISDPGLALRFGHAGDVFIPTFGFLYIAGYIGTAGRTYLTEIRSRQKPRQNEIIIDVPLATSIAFKSWDWPAKAVGELYSGTLTEKEENITRSPR